ncbi:MAG TPA: hypothetical protein VL651_00070 [Bacteroidia bacterium]|jgi:phage tail sheath protein FI|nr:hypothetical protein [Bacteroidia bacterium]
MSREEKLALIEDSASSILRGYIFCPNNAETWMTICANMEQYFIPTFNEKILLGDTFPDSFSVQCGLMTTMTAEDVLNNRINVTLKVAVERPGEFEMITLSQVQLK